MLLGKSETSEDAKADENCRKRSADGDRFRVEAAKTDCGHNWPHSWKEMIVYTNLFVVWGSLLFTSIMI
jgi:hypothetical protein